DRDRAARRVVGGPLAAEARRSAGRIRGRRGPTPIGVARSARGHRGVRGRRRIGAICGGPVALTTVADVVRLFTGSCAIKGQPVLLTGLRFSVARAFVTVLSCVVVLAVAG